MTILPQSLEQVRKCEKMMLDINGYIDNVKNRFTAAKRCIFKFKYHWDLHSTLSFITEKKK